MGRRGNNGAREDMPWDDDLKKGSWTPQEDQVLINAMRVGYSARGTTLFDQCWKLRVATYYQAASVTNNCEYSLLGYKWHFVTQHQWHPPQCRAYLTVFAELPLSCLSYSPLAPP